MIGVNQSGPARGGAGSLSNSESCQVRLWPASYTLAGPDLTGLTSCSPRLHAGASRGFEPERDLLFRALVAHAAEFSKTVRFLAGGVSAGRSHPSLDTREASWEAS